MAFTIFIHFEAILIYLKQRKHNIAISQNISQVDFFLTSYINDNQWLKMITSVVEDIRQETGSKMHLWTLISSIFSFQHMVFWYHYHYIASCFKDAAPMIWVTRLKWMGGKLGKGSREEVERSRRCHVFLLIMWL